MPKSRVRKRPTPDRRNSRASRSPGRGSDRPSAAVAQALAVLETLDLSHLPAGMGVDEVLGDLAESAVPDPAGATVRADVAARAHGLLSRWSSPELLLPLLMLGLEEGWHYQPAKVDLAARAAAVLAVRNSAVETEHAAGRVPDGELAVLTGSAAACLSAVLPPIGQDLPAGILSTQDPSPDPFAGLEVRYPAAWQALTELARLQSWQGPVAGVARELTFAPVAPAAVDLDAFAVDADRLLRHGESLVGAVLDGMAPGIDRRMVDMLQEEGFPLGVPSFKHLSRNPEVVLAVLEHQLAGEGLVTPNVALGLGWVATRAVPLRVRDDGFEVAGVLSGVSVGHRELLRVVRQEL